MRTLRHHRLPRRSLLLLALPLIAACTSPAPPATEPPATTAAAPAVGPTATTAPASPAPREPRPAPIEPTTTATPVSISAPTATVPAAQAAPATATTAPAAPTPTAAPAPPLQKPSAVIATPPVTARSAAAGLPQRLRIPRLRINTLVEHVGLDPEGLMDVPKSYETVGWYKLGTRPGQRGNAVMAGHLDSKTGPAIFWNLRVLRPGDEVFVVSDDGVERRFLVRDSQSYLTNNAPLERIFGASPSVALNLVTCNGTFDRNSLDYDQRLVVFTDLA